MQIKKTYIIQKKKIATNWVQNQNQPSINVYIKKCESIMQEIEIKITLKKKNTSKIDRESYTVRYIKMCASNVIFGQNHIRIKKVSKNGSHRTEEL